MKKRMKLLSATLGFVAVFVIPSANAVPFILFDPDHGDCILFDATDYDYLYQCQDGAILYISKRTTGGGGSGGSGGGGGGPFDG